MTEGVAHKSLYHNGLAIFRVIVLPTMKTLKYLTVNHLHATPDVVNHVIIAGIAHINPRPRALSIIYLQKKALQLTIGKA